jgi:anti-sigma factor RsiW
MEEWMSYETRQPDIELISAWMDGELDAPVAAAVQRQITEAPAWAEALRELQAVDAALDLLPAPELKVDLTERIMEEAHCQPAMLARVLRYALPAAAAAVFLLACLVWPQPPKRTGVAPVTALPAEVNDALKDVPAADRLLVWKLDMFQNYGKVKAYQPVSDVVDAETLAALDRQEPGMRE